MPTLVTAQRTVSVACSAPSLFRNKLGFVATGADKFERSENVAARTRDLLHSRDDRGE